MCFFISLLRSRWGYLVADSFCGYHARAAVQSHFLILILLCCIPSLTLDLPNQLSRVLRESGFLVYGNPIPRVGPDVCKNIHRRRFFSVFLLGERIATEYARQLDILRRGPIQNGLFPVRGFGFDRYFSSELPPRGFFLGKWLISQVVQPP